VADPDHYEAWYTHKLWTLLPGVYQAEDSPDPDEAGPLEELVDRIGVQIAVVRRSIDRLWEDQMIETCDDWVIDYIGDLLATNLVASLDARGRRVDVGKTIYYRRRKGTVAPLEELAGDITGWTVRVVEFFRRLGRTRHLLDVPIGPRSAAGDPRTDLQRAEGLVGVLTRTPAGGLADLRNVRGAQLAGSAFDEFFHTGDVRSGRGATGWHDIPRLGVFLWRLHSFGLDGASAVRDTQCPNQYTIDPTGRDLPLFAPAVPVLADVWVSPREDQVPGPISSDLLTAAFDTLYAPHSLFVRRYVGGPGPDDFVPVPPAEVSSDRRTPTGRFFIDPERGRLVAPVGADDGPYLVDYHYGFASEIGAGPYERRRPGVTLDDAPEPRVSITGGTGLAAALGGLAPSGTITIGDSRTYGEVADVSGIQTVVVRAANETQPYVRPLVRPDAATWVFTGDPGAVLTFDGLFLTGTQLVLRGDFERVSLRCSTLDPGTWDEEQGGFAAAADGRALSPASLLVEGEVRELAVERCILGPIAESAGGAVERLSALDSVVHACEPGAKSISLTSGTASLVRTTVIGPARLHRLDASECLFASDVQVDDTQHGCLRFSAWVQGSALPRQYECVPLPVGAAVLASTAFGSPDYARVLDTVGPVILEGGPDGSELGAFARERTAVKERSLLIKYREYLPLGLEPVLVHVT
jgi:hypothetical protein